MHFGGRFRGRSSRANLRVPHAPKKPRIENLLQIKLCFTYLHHRGSLEAQYLAALSHTGKGCQLLVELNYCAEFFGHWTASRSPMSGNSWVCPKSQLNCSLEKCSRNVFQYENYLQRITLTTRIESVRLQQIEVCLQITRSCVSWIGNHSGSASSCLHDPRWVWRRCHPLNLRRDVFVDFWLSIFMRLVVVFVYRYVLLSFVVVRRWPRYHRHRKKREPSGNEREEILE